jgi:hypothetical protein
MGLQFPTMARRADFQPASRTRACRTSLLVRHSFPQQFPTFNRPRILFSIGKEKGASRGRQMRPMRPNQTGPPSPWPATSSTRSPHPGMGLVTTTATSFTLAPDPVTTGARHSCCFTSCSAQSQHISLKFHGLNLPHLDAPWLLNDSLQVVVGG